jgi:hypothetical protein
MWACATVAVLAPNIRDRIDLRRQLIAAGIRLA